MSAPPRGRAPRGWQKVIMSFKFAKVRDFKRTSEHGHSGFVFRYATAKAGDYDQYTFFSPQVRRGTAAEWVRSAT